jgi:protein CpxP
MKLKSSKIGFIVAVALGALAAGTLAASAQTTNSNPQPGAGHGEKGGQLKDRLQRMAEALQLTDAEKDQIKPILQGDMEKAKELRDDTSLTQEERRAKMKTIREDTAAKMKGILTPEQFTKWEQLRAQGRGKKQPAN